MKAQTLFYLGVLGFFLLTVNLLAAASILLFASRFHIVAFSSANLFVFCYVYPSLFLTSKEQEEKSKQLAFLAYHDTLTGLPNRRLFHDRLERALLHAQRNEQLVAVMFLDMDRFKDVNDSLGHAYGDRLIRLTAERLLSLPAWIGYGVPARWRRIHHFTRILYKA